MSPPAFHGPIVANLRPAPQVAAGPKVACLRGQQSLRRSACPPDIRHQAADLLLALAAVEYHASGGGPTRVPPALLRDLIAITARLAGRTWLDANADRAAAFSALQAAWQPPPLPVLDQILARVLSDRFGLPSPTAAA